MCGLCGCTSETEMAHQHHDTTHHHHPTEQGEFIAVEQSLLAKNNQFAADNREYFSNHKITAINLMSSPGSGKTTLLAKTIEQPGHRMNMAVVVGDQQTDYDADCIKQSGGQAIQINTGKVCHLDAHAVGHAVLHLRVAQPTILFIENIGNLVCPSLFDLGEAHRVVLLSVTEGDNKPLKYPDMFRRADLILVTKMDLLPYVDFDVDKCMTYARRINPGVQFITLSAAKDSGLDTWYQWLNDNRV
ncbi:hydrogenase nickel incorporation protein HypB [Legionella spiritensis]|uniref:hydrogenase nickel incorporation protein HypB n=1 Tax=Legionella spiritensis TaxID=452 RepID=UPI000F6C1819|nr:hydrogenase nickel incorporation protein HypB [Legionella spiritensis]VEG90218.1 hydrogenase expression/formation protein HypB [Legionella spiritensis]